VLLHRHCGAAARFRATSLGCRGRRSLGYAIVAQGFKGAATRVPEAATAFGLRRDHVLIETIARFADGPDKAEEDFISKRREPLATASTRSHSPAALPNLLASGEDPGRVAR
jgi:hypothetical protein